MQFGEILRCPKLDSLSEKLIRSRWENNHGGSMNALNAVEQKLAAFLEDTSLPPYATI